MSLKYQHDAISKSLLTSFQALRALSIFWREEVLSQDRGFFDQQSIGENGVTYLFRYQKFAFCKLATESPSVSENLSNW